MEQTRPVGINIQDDQHLLSNEKLETTMVVDNDVEAKRHDFSGRMSWKRRAHQHKYGGKQRNKGQPSVMSSRRKMYGFIFIW